MPWNPQNTWEDGNFYPESGGASDRLGVAAAVPLGDVGSQQETDVSHPGLGDGAGAVSDVLDLEGFSSAHTAGEWDDDGPYQLGLHLTTVEVRDAYAAEMAAATTVAARQAVVRRYREKAVGGYWGTLGVAP